MQEIYVSNENEDMKFVTVKELEDIGGNNLLGTHLVKPYLHGFFIEMKLYKKLHALTLPFDYEVERKKEREAKFKKLYGDRIVIKNRRKYNSAIAEKSEIGQKIVRDGRFDKMFEDENYIVENADEVYKIKRDDKEDEEIGDTKIIEQKILDMKDELLRKKRKKVSTLFTNNNEEEMVEEEEASEDSAEVEGKINKLEAVKKNKQKVIEKKKANKQKMDGRRLMGSSDKLRKIKFK